MSNILVPEEITYIASEDKAFLQRNELDRFDALWDMDIPWFEEPNQRRGGWSGVVRFSAGEGDDKRIFFLKRQEGHNYITPRRPFKGLPTFYREFFNLRRLKQLQIPSLHVVTYQHRFINGNWRSLLMTDSLEGFFDLDILRDHDRFSDEERLQILASAAQIMKKLHNQHLQHCELYPKHFMFSINDGKVDMRFIDLERMRRKIRYNWSAYQDISKFLRRSKLIMSNEEEQFIISTYLKEPGEKLNNSYLERKITRKK